MSEEQSIQWYYVTEIGKWKVFLANFISHIISQSRAETQLVMAKSLFVPLLMHKEQVIS